MSNQLIPANPLLPPRPRGTLLPQDAHHNGPSPPLNNAALHRLGPIARPPRTMGPQNLHNTPLSPNFTSSSIHMQANSSRANFHAISNNRSSPNVQRELIQPGLYGNVHNAIPYTYPASPPQPLSPPSRMNPAASCFNPAVAHLQSPFTAPWQPPSPWQPPPPTPWHPPSSTAPPIPPRTLGWPPSQHPLRKQHYNTHHPSTIPDTIFLTDLPAGTIWHSIQNVYDDRGAFAPPHTPWFTHWFVAFANYYSRAHPPGQGGWTQADLCRAYVWRFGGFVPRLERLTVGDFEGLYGWLVGGKRDYAFEWEEGLEAWLWGEVERCVRATGGRGGWGEVEGGGETRLGDGMTYLG